jgi:hypothetical protein
MSVKVLCPRCTSEIHDPADLRSVTCPSCRFTFDFNREATVVTPPDPARRWARVSQIREHLPGPPGAPAADPAPPATGWRLQVAGTAAAVLCGIVLVALWIAAWRMKDAKLAARMKVEEPLAVVPSAPPRLRVSADRRLQGTDAKTLAEFFARWARDHPGREADVEIDPASPPMRQREVTEEAERHRVPLRFVTSDSGLARLVLRRGDRLRVESFTLHFRPRVDNVSVYDAAGAHCVEFVRIQKGERRAWQELQLAFLDVEKDAFTMEVELKPGAPCHGRGFYRRLKTGLRVEFPRDRSLTILHWDPSKPEMKLRVDGFGQSREETFGEKGERRVLTVYCRLLKTEEGFLLQVDDLD